MTLLSRDITVLALTGKVGIEARVLKRIKADISVGQKLNGIGIAFDSLPQCRGARTVKIGTVSMQSALRRLPDTVLFHPRDLLLQMSRWAGNVGTPRPARHTSQRSAGAPPHPEMPSAAGCLQMNRKTH